MDRIRGQGILQSEVMRSIDRLLLGSMAEPKGNRFGDLLARILQIL